MFLATQKLRTIAKVYFGIKSTSTYQLTPFFILHLNIFCYAFAFWMTQPILPFLTKQLGADVVVFGYFQTFFSVAQFIGGPFIGQVVDSHGANVALLLSQSGCALAYFALSITNSILTLFLSQVPTVLMHAMQAAQAGVSLISTSEDRATAVLDAIA